MHTPTPSPLHPLRVHYIPFKILRLSEFQNLGPCNLLTVQQEEPKTQSDDLQTGCLKCIKRPWGLIGAPHDPDESTKKRDESSEAKYNQKGRCEWNEQAKGNETNERTKEPIYERKKRDGDGVNEKIKRTEITETIERAKEPRYEQTQRNDARWTKRPNETK